MYKKGKFLGGARYKRKQNMHSLQFGAESHQYLSGSILGVFDNDFIGGSKKVTESERSSRSLSLKTHLGQSNKARVQDRMLLQTLNIDCKVFFDFMYFSYKY